MPKIDRIRMITDPPQHAERRTGQRSRMQPSQQESPGTNGKYRQTKNHQPPILIIDGEDEGERDQANAKSEEPAPDKTAGEYLWQAGEVVTIRQQRSKHQ